MWGGGDYFQERFEKLVLFEEVTFEQRFECSEEGNHVSIWEENRNADQR